MKKLHDFFEVPPWERRNFTNMKSPTSCSKKYQHLEVVNPIHYMIICTYIYILYYIILYYIYIILYYIILYYIYHRYPINVIDIIFCCRDHDVITLSISVEAWQGDERTPAVLWLDGERQGKLAMKRW